MAHQTPEGAERIARALRLVANEVHRGLQMSTQSGRFRIQKTTYLLKRLGYGPARRYSYNLYLKGPYSPDLAKAYYAIGNPGLLLAKPAEDVPSGTLKTVVAAMSRDDAFLEGLATALNVSSSTQPFSRAISMARLIKPHIAEGTWSEVVAFVQEHPRLTRPT